MPDDQPDETATLTTGVAATAAAATAAAAVGATATPPPVVVGRGEAAEGVAEALGARPTVVNARFCKPIDATLMRQLAERHRLVVTIEDHAELAGFGSAVLECLEGAPARVLRLGIPDRFVDHGQRGKHSRWLCP